MAFPRFRLSLDEWPASDHSAWLVARRAGDPLDDPGAASHWTRKTTDTVVRAYGIWLAFLRTEGGLDPDAHPRTRVTREALAAYVAWMQTRDLSSITIAGRITNLREAIRVMYPDADLALLNYTLARLNAISHPKRRKDARIVSPVVLTQAAVAQMSRYRPPADGAVSRRAAGRYRDALMTAILASRPIRLANLSAMELNRHLQKRGEVYWCRFEEAETKDKHRLDFPLPTALTSWIDLYLQVYWPALLRGLESGRLWVSIRGTPMTDNTIYCAICQVTIEKLGQPINPHLFRDCVSTFIAEEAPEQVQIIAPILGHVSLKTSEKHYNQAGMLSAQKRYLDAIAKIRCASSEGDID